FGRSRAGPARRRQFGLVLFALLEARPHAAARSAPRLSTLTWRPGFIFHATISALRRLRGPQGLADKRLAQNQPCLGDAMERKHGFDCFAWLCVAAIERQYGISALAFDLANPAAEALS